MSVKEVKTIFDKFYDKNKCEFDEVKHVHIINGELYTGVTTVTDVRKKDFLAPWAVKEMYKYLLENIKPNTPYTPEDIDTLLLAGKGAWTSKSTKAKTTGTDAHDFISKYILQRNLTIPSDEEVVNAVQAFRKWETETKPKWIASEKQIASTTYKIAGILDSLCNLDNKFTLLDFKTSTDFRDDNILQLAGYLILLNEMGVFPEEARILRIPKDGTDAELSPNLMGKNMDFFKEVFLHLREAHKFNVFIKNNVMKDRKLDLKLLNGGNYGN